MGLKQYSHEEDKIPTPSLTVEKILMFALEKYMDRSHINNYVWGLSSKREAEFVALAAKVTTLKGNLKLDDKIAKKQKSSGGVGGAATKARTGKNHESQKEETARLDLWKSDFIALKKI